MVIKKLDQPSSLKILPVFANYYFEKNVELNETL